MFRIVVLRKVDSGKNASDVASGRLLQVRTFLYGGHKPRMVREGAASVSRSTRLGRAVLLAIFGLANMAHANRTLQRTEVPVHMRDSLPFVDVKINGKDAKLRVGAAAFFSLLWRSSLPRLNHTARSSDGLRINGIRSSFRTSLTTAHDFMLGTSALPNMDFIVAGLDSDTSLREESGVLGHNVLHASDAE